VRNGIVCRGAAHDLPNQESAVIRGVGRPSHLGAQRNKAALCNRPQIIARDRGFQPRLQPVRAIAPKPAALRPDASKLHGASMIEMSCLNRDGRRPATQMSDRTIDLTPSEVAHVAE
jgi:hypothetical protein